MPRYVSRPKAFWEDEDFPMVPELSVDLSPPKDTGLLDRSGEPLYRLPDEIGFLRALASKSFTER